MGIFGSIAKGVGKVVSAPVKLVGAASKPLVKTVQNVTKNTPIGGITKQLTSIKISANPIKTIGSVVGAHANAGKFLFSKEAAAIGGAAFTGGASAAAVAAGGKSASLLFGAAQSGKLSINGAKDVLGQLADNPMDFVNSVQKQGLGGALGGIVTRTIGDTNVRAKSSFLPTSAKTSVAKSLSTSMVSAGNGGLGVAPGKSIIVELIELPFKILGLIK